MAQLPMLLTPHLNLKLELLPPIVVMQDTHLLEIVYVLVLSMIRQIPLVCGVELLLSVYYYNGKQLVSIKTTSHALYMSLINGIRYMPDINGDAPPSFRNNMHS